MSSGVPLPLPACLSLGASLLVALAERLLAAAGALGPLHCAVDGPCALAKLCQGARAFVRCSPQLDCVGAPEAVLRLDELLLGLVE